MADCGTEYAFASFRGVEFEILPVDESGGRRIVTNQYPFTDVHYNEDLGQIAARWSVKGCFYGDDFRDKLTTAKRTWQRPGAGIFFEPTENVAHDVTLISWAYNYDNKKLNYIDFTLEFVAASEKPYPSSLNIRSDNVNTSAIVETYLDDVRAIYRRLMRGINTFVSTVNGLRASTKFLDNAARSLLAPLSFLQTGKAIRRVKPSRDADANLASIEAVYEAAISSDAPPAFFKRASEARAAGDETVATQANMTALIALGYYFESLSGGIVTFADLAEFRDRAQSIKLAQPQSSGAVDTLVAQLGAVAQPQCSQDAPGYTNALVASYRLFGDVSRAYDILQLSNGVSGSDMSAMVTPCDIL